MTKLLRHFRCFFLSMGYTYAINIRSMYGYNEEAKYLMDELKKLRKECC
jgi:hypothetical protein